MITVILLLLVLFGVIVGITDPFGGTGKAKASAVGNSDPTSFATVRKGTLSSQTEVDATLGYTGSYTVSIPSGTSASSLGQARATTTAAGQKVVVDKQSLTQARSVAGAQSAATLTAARSTVTTDETTLFQAKAQLTEDETLNCPAASSATVTTPITAGNTSAGSSGSSTNSSSASAASGTPSPASTAGDPSAPAVTTGSASGTTIDATTLSGSVNPNGADTSYSFEYGTTPSFGSTTPAQSAGSGMASASVSADISGLKADTTYEFALVATNADGTVTGTAQSFATAQSSCVEQKQVVATDTASLVAAKDTLSADEAGDTETVAQAEDQLSTDEASMNADGEALSLAESAQATNPGAVLTGLPVIGAVVSRGQAVYDIAGHGVPLFYGSVTPWRALYPGVSNGADVTELNANLVALGFEHGATSGPQFSATTESAVRAWQASTGAPASGVVSLGDLVVAPGPIDVDSVSATVGEAVQPGSSILDATSLTREVTVDLDASQQTDVKVGDRVSITLPNNATTPGVVSSVGSVAVCPSGSSTAGSSSSGGVSGCTSSQSGSSATPTITVEVTLMHPSAAGTLDQAPVTVSITTASVNDALIVPVDALLALSGGGYAVEVQSGSADHLVPVSLGLFDDAGGLVQVSGNGIEAGERIVVPTL